MREVIKSWLKKLEFMTGLKQFRVDNPNDPRHIEDMKTLLDCLEEKVKEYHWMNEFRLNEIMKKGMEGGYGDFFSINVRTISQWCNMYQEHHKQLLIIENFPRDKEPEKSQEEIDFWIAKGRQMFLDKWNEAKEGYVDSLAFWGPSYYQKFIDLGLLVEENYRFDERYETKMLKAEKGFGFSPSMLVSKKKEMVWKQFVKDMVSQGVDLPSYL